MAQPEYLDPHTFRRDYMARLANLPVNWPYDAGPVPQTAYLDQHTFRRDYMARLANRTVS